MTGLYKSVYIMKMTASGKRASIGITPETGEKVKKIIAKTGEKHYRMIDRLVTKELAKIQKKQAA